VGADLNRLRERSPIRCEDGEPKPEEVIDRLFPGDPLLCLGARKDRFRTAAREEWRGKEHLHELIVPSPMSALTGTNKNGKSSKRCLDNTGPRRFLVFEFDSGTQDEQAAIILHLAAKMPLVMVLFSGGKSLHAWFLCEGLDDGILRPFMDYAVRLGADRATWSRCQMVRFPGGYGADQKACRFPRRSTTSTPISFRDE